MSQEILEYHPLTKDEIFAIDSVIELDELLASREKFKNVLNDAQGALINVQKEFKDLLRHRKSDDPVYDQKAREFLRLSLDKDVKVKKFLELLTETRLIMFRLLFLVEPVKNESVRQHLRYLRFLIEDLPPLYEPPISALTPEEIDRLDLAQAKARYKLIHSYEDDTTKLDKIIKQKEKIKPKNEQEERKQLAEVARARLNLFECEANNLELEAESIILISLINKLIRKAEVEESERVAAELLQEEEDKQKKLKKRVGGRS